MANLISEESLNEFKTSYCDENEIIPVILKEKVAKYFVSPILDVGSGLGEISARAIPEKNVIHLDPIDCSEHPIPSAHTRVVGDFFTYTPAEPVNTVFMSHVLQYLDDDVSRLNTTLSKLSPKHLITITNKNQDFLGALLVWFKQTFPTANPEVILPDFPAGYSQIDIFPFTAHLVCPTFPVLAKQIFYLFEIENTDANNARLTEFLEQNLTSPAFTIDQNITVYSK